MVTVSSANLADVLRQLNLLESAQVEELTRDLQSRFPESRALASELLQRGWLSAYQINQLFHGRGNELLLGSYVLIERLGAGGMGQVFKARHQKMGRIVALKLIRKDRLSKPDAVNRFEHEIRAAAQLSHPNIVTAYDAAQVGDTHFFVMEYVEGTDLDRLVRDTGPLPNEQACAFIRQAALGLQHAHEKGMVHRDIKPSNLLQSIKEGQIKILDMGVARLLAEPITGDSATQAAGGGLVGTPDFEAPEQARESDHVDIRADLYSLGCTFYFLLTGRPPFPGGGMGEKLVKHQLEEPEPVEKLNPEVTPEVAQVVRRLMAKNREDRYQTPAELAAALEKFVLHEPEAKPTPKPGLVGRLLAPLRRHPVITTAAIVVLAIALGSSYALGRIPRYHTGLGYSLKHHPADAVEFNGRWYVLYPEKTTSWADAKKRCQEMGGYLACVRSTEEQQFVVKIANKQTVWLGGYNDEKSNWLWITGEPIALTFWAKGFPRHGPNVQLLLINSFWHDVSPERQKAYSAGILCVWDF